MKIVNTYILKLPNKIKVNIKKRLKLLNIQGPLGHIKYELFNNITFKKRIIKINFKYLGFFFKKFITYYYKLKRNIIELLRGSFVFLKIIGVGYKIYKKRVGCTEWLLFKLGFSHLLNFRIPSFINVACLKDNKLLLYGLDFNKITQTASAIKKLRNINLYTGKGIIYKDVVFTKKN